MLDYYINLVTAHPLLSAAVQFAILGTLGEAISFFMVRGGLKNFCTGLELVGKLVAWALMGLMVKLGFMGISGFKEALQAGGMLPAWAGHGLGHAFVLSLLLQAFFGPQLMYFHRLEDNLILRRMDFSGMSTALWALLWFWLPAHTVTFMLDKPYQIGLAAAWSVALGLILGYAKSKGGQVSPATA